ncbi:Hypothetical protein A7982_08208 [Minicystis rosea]|nr:Hypothetical protein A7982_08208 [Minicystis rosea]
MMLRCGRFARWAYGFLLAWAPCTLVTGCSATDPETGAEDSTLHAEETGAATEAVRRAVVTETQGPYATISLFPDAVFGDFFASGTILRASDSTACVGRIRSVREGKSLVGEMKVTSTYLAATGAPSATVTLDQDIDNEYVFFGGPPFVYPRDRSSWAHSTARRLVSFSR